MLITHAGTFAGAHACLPDAPAGAEHPLGVGERGVLWALLFGAMYGASAC